MGWGCVGSELEKGTCANECVCMLSYLSPIQSIAMPIWYNARSSLLLFRVCVPALLCPARSPTAPKLSTVACWAMANGICFPPPLHHSTLTYSHSHCQMDPSNTYSICVQSKAKMRWTKPLPVSRQSAGGQVVFRKAGRRKRNTKLFFCRCMGAWSFAT